MINDLISIIIPINNTQKYIEECINSIVSQTYSNYEVILVDNNSVDDSISIAKRILECNSVEHRVYVETQQGQCNAKNTGIDKARGDWICFIDSDDVVSPRYLETLLNCIHSMGVDVAFCDYTFDYKSVLKKDRKVNSYNKYSQEEISKKYLLRNIGMIIPGMLIRRQQFIDNDRIRNNTSMLQGEDAYQLWLILANNDSMGYCNNKLYGYRRRNGSTTTGIDIKRIASCHDGFEKLRVYCAATYEKEFIDSIIYRQDFGLIRSSAQYASYVDFSEVRKLLFNSKFNSVMCNFPDIRVVIMTHMLKYVPFLFWGINHYLLKV